MRICVAMVVEGGGEMGILGSCVRRGCSGGGGVVEVESIKDWRKWMIE